MVKYDIVDDASTLLGVSNKSVNNFIEVLQSCILSAIVDAKAQQEDSLILNLGLSEISIDLVNLQWKSVPTKNTKTKLKNLIVSHEDCPVKEAVLDQVRTKLLSILDEVN